jgi:NADPH-dependent 2,4-dienoyl-CoA reductase/sulfur reductase-like enzyme/predicted acylesterase/phospholipase RssA
LSKDYLLKDIEVDRLYVEKKEFFKTENIELVPGTRADSVDTGKRVLHADNGKKYKYNKLLIATGSRVKKIGLKGGGLKGVHYLRTIEDAKKLKASMKSAKKAVVLGSSFIGMELAATFTESDIKCTVIAHEELLYSKLNSSEISQFFYDYYSERGVKFIFDDSLSKISGRKGVTSVVTESGRRIPCDILAIGIGVTPEKGFLEGSGIETDNENGILTNEYLETNVEGVYAAGDVTYTYNPVFGTRMRTEHWDNAVKQGRTAAKNMMGMRQQFRYVSYFFSDVFDLSFNFLGDPGDVDERIVRGSFERESVTVLYLKDDVLRAAFTMGRSESERGSLNSLIEFGVSLTNYKDKLRDEDYDISTIPLQNVLLLQGGGAMGSFQSGVVRAMEERGIFPDVVAGISIGSFNAAIIAGNPGNASSKLTEFWKEVSLNLPALPDEEARRVMSSMYCLLFGSPEFFRPKWSSSLSLKNISEPPYKWTSFYDTSPVKELLNKSVDFGELKNSPVRLLVSAVDVETAELITFDSYIDDITPDHIIASGSLPPGLPWTEIDGRYYWDGGIVSNSPLNIYTEKFGLEGKKLYVVNLYQKENRLPRNMMEVMSRKDEIFYSEKIRNEIRTMQIMEDYRRLVRELSELMDGEQLEKMKSRPLYIETMKRTGPVSITRFERKEDKGEMSSRDYDFSWSSVSKNMEKGYSEAKKTLRESEDGGK